MRKTDRHRVKRSPGVNRLILTLLVGAAILLIYSILPTPDDGVRIIETQDAIFSIDPNIRLIEPRRSNE